MSKIVGFSVYEKVAIGITNPGQLHSIPITDAMWANVCKRADRAGMDPIAFFDKVVEDGKTQAELDTPGSATR
jgi:hypothetical protein